MLTHDFLVAISRKGRIDIIRTLRAYPDRDFTVNELAKAAKVPTMTTWRAVRELRKIGLVKARRVGNALAVSIADDKEKQRILRLIPDTDPQKAAARLYAGVLGEHAWLDECRLFGSIGRGEHAPGEEVDIAVVYDDSQTTEDEAKAAAKEVADRVKSETNVTVIPLSIPRKDMSRKGGLAAELRDKETIWKRKSA